MEYIGIFSNLDWCTFKWISFSLFLTHLVTWYCRSSHRRCSVRKSVLKNFSKFTGKQLCQSLFLIKLQACNFIKKETLARLFSREFCEISKNAFFTEHLWATASDIGFLSKTFQMKQSFGASFYDINVAGSNCVSSKSNWGEITFGTNLRQKKGREQTTLFLKKKLRFDYFITLKLTATLSFLVVLPHSWVLTEIECKISSFLTH